jgi:hypothetical protein
MAAINANEYFSTISNLASKFASDVELIQQICIQNVEWDSMSVEEQEEMVDRYMMGGQNIADKYESRIPTDELPSCFPVLKINSGEKIVVDFDHEESQQDLTLADLEEFLNPKEDPSKKSRFAKRPRSPDRSIWESPLLNGEKNKNEIEKMFEKFGIKMTSDDEDEETAPEDGTAAAGSQLPIDDKVALFLSGQTESSSLFGVSNGRYDNKSFAFDGDDTPDSLQSSPSRQLIQRNDSVDLPRRSESSITGKDKRKKHREKKEKQPNKEKKSRHGKEKHRQKDIAVHDSGASVHHQAAAPRSGDISFGTVKLSQQSIYSLQNSVADEDDDEKGDDGSSGVLKTISRMSSSDVRVAGSSFSDDMPSVHGSFRTKIVLAEPPPGESNTDDFVFSEHDETRELTQLELSTSELLPITLPTATDDNDVGSTVKTGFAFLDNW